jgi:hypothetical protein
VDRRFRDTYCLHHQGDEMIVFMMEAVRTSETSVHFNLTTRSYIPEDSKLQYSQCFAIIGNSLIVVYFLTLISLLRLLIVFSR